MNKISEKSHKPKSCYLAYSFTKVKMNVSMFEHIFFNFRLSYSPFPDIGFLYRKNLVNKTSEEPLIWVPYMLHTITDKM